MQEGADVAPAGESASRDPVKTHRRHRRAGLTTGPLTLAPCATPSPNGAAGSPDARAGTPNQARRTGRQAHADTSPPHRRHRLPAPLPRQALQSPDRGRLRYRLTPRPRPRASQPPQLLKRGRIQNRASAHRGSVGVGWGRKFHRFLCADPPGGLRRAERWWSTPRYPLLGGYWTGDVAGERGPVAGIARRIQPARPGRLRRAGRRWNRSGIPTFLAHFPTTTSNLRNCVTSET
jgi:hypothetical protein